METGSTRLRAPPRTKPLIRLLFYRLTYQVLAEISKA